MADPVELSADAFEPQAETPEEENLHRYEVPNVKTGEPLGEMVMRGFKQPVLDRYREIRNGTGRAKGDNGKAREYLFRRTFVRFEPYPVDGVTPTLNLGQCKTPLEFFLAKALMVVDAVVQQHVAAVFPDVDEKK
ncbi:MAG TPA: hypothetical protein VJ464_15835 [Blastocatellia bacterium]|nr:hypothetical protein [Blastocatellia bacterium]